MRDVAQIYAEFSTWAEKPFVLTNGMVVAALVVVAWVCFLTVHADYRRAMKEMDRRDRELDSVLKKQAE